MTDRPTLWFVAGPNGVGKTTYAFRHIKRVSGSFRFINLDEIARGISPLDPQEGRIEAARIALAQTKSWLLEQPNGLDHRRAFTIETTLAGLTHLRLIETARNAGWRVAMLYFAVASVEIALQRIARRVSEGGHDVPEQDARRRFSRSIANFARYASAIDEWRIISTMRSDRPAVVAEGRRGCRFEHIERSDLPEELVSVVESMAICTEI